MSAGRARETGFGPFPAVSLEDARNARDSQKRVRQSGLDPIEARDQERAAAKLTAVQAITFSAAVAAYIKDKSHTWKNEKHRQQWTNTLATYAEPILGALPVQAITTALVKKVLDPIWIEKSETASILRGRIEAVLD